MASGRTVSIDQVTSFCVAKANENRVHANRKGLNASKSHGDRLHRERHLAMAVMADAIGAHFETLPDDRTSDETLRCARRLDPDAFAKREAMIERLLEEGADRSYAERAATATWGARVSSAVAAARRMDEAGASSSIGSDDFAIGVEAVAAWHDRRAEESEEAARTEPSPERRSRFGSRAERHRLYARHIRRDFEGRTKADRPSEALERDPAQHSLPLPVAMRRAAEEAGRPKAASIPDDPLDQGVPLEVQAAFLKRGEAFDDEGER